MLSPPGLPLPTSTISDLAYCAAAEVMVTASWDSTVKVWESDWQIRMVFVGHTGALLGPILSPPCVQPPRSRISTGSSHGSLHWLQPGLLAPLPSVPGAPK